MRIQLLLTTLSKPSKKKRYNMKNYLTTVVSVFCVLASVIGPGILFLWMALEYSLWWLVGLFIYNVFLIAWGINGIKKDEEKE